MYIAVLLSNHIHSTIHCVVTTSVVCRMFPDSCGATVGSGTGAAETREPGADISEHRAPRAILSFSKFDCLSNKLMMLDCKRKEGRHKRELQGIIPGIISRVITVKMAAGTCSDYPEVRRDESVVEDHYGQQVVDPYRWLEDPDSEETVQFVKAQNALSRPFLESCPARNKFHDRY